MDEILSRKRIGHVERKIADATAVRKELQLDVLEDKITVGVGRAHPFENPLPAGLENPRCSDPYFETRNAERGGRNGPLVSGPVRRGLMLPPAHTADGLSVFLRVFKLAVDRLHAAAQ